VAANRAGDPDPRLIRETTVAAARTAGAILKAGYGHVAQVRLKGQVDVVTEVDVRSEAEVVALIRARFPEHQILAEEGSTGGADPRFRWIIDPLDGTTNFANGIPFFCVSVAFEQDGQVRCGAILDPLREELFLAERGAGATLNDRPIQPSATAELIRSVVATGFPYDRTLLPGALRQFGALSACSRAVRRLGSAALDCAYVSCGRFEAYWEATVSPWDVAAGWLLVEEAGGRITDLLGQPYELAKRDILVTNGQVHAAMLEALGQSA
jgi:myo-inositol-1(or 4)-monophosphatase